MKTAHIVLCGIFMAAALLFLQSAGTGKTGSESREYYIGTWEVSYTNGLTVFFQLNANGSAVKTVKSVAGSVNGSWKLKSDGALITWADGWRDLIKPDRTNWAYAPGTSLDRPPFNTGTANKIKQNKAVGSKRTEDRGTNDSQTNGPNQVYGPNDNYRNPIPQQ
jgi:hypothetical protein